MAKEIAEVINDAGVLVPRDEKQVRNKIQHLERQFRDAYDFANTETGAGLMETDGVLFDDAVMQKCNHYYDLLDLFSDRASSKPKATNMDDSLASSDPSVDSVLSTGNEKTPSTKRPANYSTSSKKSRKTGTNFSASDQTSAATVRLATVKTDMLSFQLSQLEEDREGDRESRALERQSKVLDSQMHLVRQCMAFVSENRGWKKEDILRLFPAFEPIIDVVLANTDR